MEIRNEIKTVNLSTWSERYDGRSLSPHFLVSPERGSITSRRALRRKGDHLWRKKERKPAEFRSDEVHPPRSPTMTTMTRTFFSFSAAEVQRSHHSFNWKMQRANGIQEPSMNQSIPPPPKGIQYNKTCTF